MQLTVVVTGQATHCACSANVCLRPLQIFFLELAPLQCYGVAGYARGVA
jgi:hypothetical protein